MRKNIKLIAGGVASLVVIALMAAFFLFNTVGRAIVFAVSDPATVNHAAQLKASYVNQFSLQTVSPKADR